MNLASALFKRILETEDFDTWSSLRRHYLPSEYHVIYDIIDKQIDIEVVDIAYKTFLNIIKPN